MSEITQRDNARFNELLSIAGNLEPDELKQHLAATLYDLEQARKPERFVQTQAACEAILEAFEERMVAEGVQNGNYMEWDVARAGGPTCAILIYRKDGKSPSDVAQERFEEIQALKHERELDLVTVTSVNYKLGLNPDEPKTIPEAVSAIHGELSRRWKVIAAAKDWWLDRTPSDAGEMALCRALADAFPSSAGSEEDDVDEAQREAIDEINDGIAKDCNENLPA